MFAHDKADWIDTILILIYTGMRISELLQPKLVDVDIKEMLIVGGVKTDAGRDRVVPVHKSIQKYVRQRFLSSDAYLVEENGKRMRPEHYRALYYEALDGLGVRRLTRHKARHTFFTMFDASCSDKLAMAFIGGHTDPNFTEKQYVHPDIERLRAAMDQLK